MADISYLTTICFENGALRELSARLKTIGIARPLIATDRGIVQAGLLDQLTAVLGNIPDDQLYADTPPNPTESSVDAAARQYRQSGCDGIVAFGGGSPIDLAKAVALKATHPGELVDYSAQSGTKPITAATAPVIAVPTTSGTGSEVGRATVIVMNDGRKRAVVSPYLVPKLALCDPLLTVGMPAAITAGTGMDAIAHCVETLLSPRINPPADAIALDGLVRATSWLRKACKDGADLEARWELMMASLEGGLAFQKGLGAVHALSHALGTLRDPVLHHGTLNAVLLPPVLAFNKMHAAGKVRRMRRALGLGDAADLSAWFTALTRDVGLPTTLAQMGVARSILPQMAAMSVGDFSAQTNPAPVSQAEYLGLLESVFDREFQEYRQDMRV
jgi:4-hydroxybutyrate dehydrogenase